MEPALAVPRSEARSLSGAKNRRPVEPKLGNEVIRGVHGIGERADSLLETTFKALRCVSLSP